MAFAIQIVCLIFSVGFTYWACWIQIRFLQDKLRIVEEDRNFWEKHAKECADAFEKSVKKMSLDLPPIQKQHDDGLN